VVPKAALAGLRVRGLVQVPADGTLGPPDQCCDQLDGSVVFGAVLHSSDELSGLVDGPGHSFGLVEVVLAHGRGDQVVLERHRLSQRFLEDAGVSTEQVCGILALRQVRHVKTKGADTNVVCCL
jgi:hypothetical protein